jgi:selenocysteine lyase/cysteine desulfurase
LQLILECGMEAVEARVLGLARQIIAQATRAGFTVIGPTEGAGLSGIVSLSAKATDVAKLHAKLNAVNVITSLRYTRDGRKCLRLSPHLYNRDEELPKLDEMA